MRCGKTRTLGCMEQSAVQRLIELAKTKEQGLAERALLTSGALPVPWAWVEGSFGIRENGEVVYADETGQFQSMESLGDVRSNTLVTLFYAVKRNPELAYLLPPKPKGASRCTGCDGKGTVVDDQLVCGDCLGLGWGMQPNSAFLTDAFSLLRRACGAAKRGR